MTSQPSSSELTRNAFDLLHPDVQRWIWDKGWTSLRDIQALAISAILKSGNDVIIAATTASGKTEAAFLPILSHVVGSVGEGIRALYVGPLKALINDQFQRLEDLCEQLKLPVAKWHGDASQTMKRRAREKPAGVLLITPESLEALFVRRPGDIARMFSNLDFIVIDELHAFLDSDRGVHLASLLKRIAAATGHRARRIGLSATLGDLTIAAAWLHSSDPDKVTIIDSRATGATIKLQIRGVEQPRVKKTQSQSQRMIEKEAALSVIAEHIFRTIHGHGNHLVFAGSRSTTELLSDKLRALCEATSVPNEFFPHHGNLSREMREALEERLKKGNLPTTAVATTTLELGIDIGSVESVAQVGAPASISALRQRLGRSGRREGSAAALRIYTVERPLDADASIFDRLRVETVQAVAAIRLLLKKWIEPPRGSGLHLSTLLHQTLSVIVERGGIQPQAAFRLLGGEGPFKTVTPDLYVRLLRAMRAHDPPLLDQAPDGSLMLGQLGEVLTSSYDFYSVFASYDEFTVLANGKALGTLSVRNVLGPDDYLIFAGRRWKVLEVDDVGKRVMVEAAPAGRVPIFEGEAATIHDALVKEVKAVYLDSEIPIYLDQQAKIYLEEGRAAFRAMSLDSISATEDDGRLYLFPWVGTDKLDTLRLALRYCGLQPEQARIAVSVPVSEGARLREVLAAMRTAPPPADALALLSQNLRSAKYDSLLPDDLLRDVFAAHKLNPDCLPILCASLSLSTPFAIAVSAIRESSA